MRGPYHHFLLLEEAKHHYVDYMRFIRSDDERIDIPDYFIWYMGDTLKWVPARYPSKRSDGPRIYGLNHYGPTIITSEGGEILRHVCGAWAHLLSQGPELLRLRGPYMTEIQEDPVQTGDKELFDGQALRVSAMFGGYQDLEFDREDLVQRLQALARYAEQVMTGRFYILHLGI